jgi:hypothetical protein
LNHQSYRTALIILFDEAADLFSVISQLPRQIINHAAPLVGQIESSLVKNTHIGVKYYPGG